MTEEAQPLHYALAPLSDQHDVSEFVSGDDYIDAYLMRQAIFDQREDKHVLTFFSTLRRSCQDR